MKKQMVVAVALWVLTGLTAVSAQAQERVRVRVPFDFAVADRSFPQGEYFFSSVREKVFVQDAHGKTVAMLFSNAVSGRAVDATGLVVFQCYERSCFLSEVWDPTQAAGRQVLRSHWEQQVARRKMGTYFALAAEGSK